MKKIQNNLHYFKVSQNNPETPLDSFYIFTQKNSQLKNYIDNTKEIKSILITIKTLEDNHDDPKIINKYFRKLSQTLNQFSTCSEFNCFINACDSFLDSTKNNPLLLKKITHEYFKNRIMSELVPEQWIQAILDTNSGRKKGKSGEKKLLSILKNYGYKEINSWEDFANESKCVAKFSRVFNIKNIRKNLHIKLSTKKQNKNLDLIIKNGEQIYLCEAKHLNTSGGGQDKQISELIEILSLKEKSKTISYISFLDGTYSNILLGDQGTGPKLITQRQEILKYLSQNKNNYWVNTAGFKKLLS